ncbi:MAG: AsmA family protein [Proteobacteria bacterium]|nr:AsmA family protein [Burkholderiales bacterium]
MAAYIALAIFLLVVLLVLLFDWNWLKRPLERFVTERSGRELVIGGDITGSWSFTPTFTFRDVRFANPQWAEQRTFVEAEQVSLTIPLRSVIRGEPVINDLSILGANVGLEVGPEGKRSWRLNPTQDDPKAAIRFKRIVVERGVVRYLDRSDDTDVVAKVGARAEGTTNLEVTGRARKTPLTLAITTVGAAQALEAATKADSPSPSFRGKGRIGEASVEFKGQLGPGYGVAGTQMDIRASGPDLSAFRPLARAAVPSTPPYKLDVQVSVAEERVDVALRPSSFGESRLLGKVSVNLGGERKRVEGVLTASPLDFDDLAPLIGAAPSIKPGETASPAQRKTAAAAVRRGRVLPDAPFDTTLWPNVDIDITLKAEKVVDSGRLAIESFSFRARLTEGNLEVSPLAVSMAGGKIDGGVSLLRRPDAVALKSAIRFSGLKLDRILPKSDTVKASFGQINGSLDLSGQGRSVGTILAASSGRLGLVMGPGEVSNLLLELVGLDGGEALAFLIRGDRTSKLRCAVASMPIKNGTVVAEAVVFDTEDTNIVMSGSADLQSERIDFTLHPRPKDWSLFSLRSPIHLRGTFSDPSVSLDAAGVGARAAGAVLLGLLNPIAALIPLIETGGGEDANCQALLSEMRSAATKGASGSMRAKPAAKRPAAERQ